MPTIDPSVRPRRGPVWRRALAVLAFLTLSTSGSAFAVESPEIPDPCDSSLILLEEHVVRENGQPGPATFEVDLPLDGVVCVEAEAGGGLASAVVRLAGQRVFSPSDFPTDAPIRSTVELPAGTAELAVELRSRPGSSLTLRLRQGLPEGGFPEELLPTPVVERSLVERRVLRKLPGRPASEAETGIDLAVKMKNVRVRGWRAAVFAVVTRAADEEVVAVETETFELPVGESRIDTRLVVSGTDLPPGAYTVRPVIFAGLGSHTVEAVERIPDLFPPEVRPAAVFVAGAEDGVEVVDQGLDEIRAYETAIASGNPDTVYKALSSLISHYRLRGQYDLAEQAVELAGARLQAFGTTAGEPAGDDLQRIFRFWNVDDRRLAGDPIGATVLLETLIDEAPAGASFFGEPFQARGLLELGRLQASAGRWDAARGAYDRLIAEHPRVHRSTAHMERASVHLRRGDLAAARADYEEVMDIYIDCSNPIIIEATGTGSTGAETCPNQDQATEAERKIRILTSDRSWFRDRPEDLVAGFERALDRRDIAELDALATPHGFRYVHGSGEARDLEWDVLPRKFFQRVLESSPDLDLTVGDDLGTRQVVKLSGISSDFGTSEVDSVYLTLEETAFGWQWGGFATVAPLLDDTDGYDPCKVLGALNGCPDLPPTPPPSDPPLVTRAPSNLAIEAPWAPGVHMRAGGLAGWFDFVQLGLEGLLGLLNIPLLTDECGISIPGYHYGIGTHADPWDNFAIDYTQGWTYFCVFGLCVSPTGVLESELVEVLENQLNGSPTVTPAFNDPAVAAHSGIVLQSIFDFEDGDTDGSHANKVMIGVFANPLGVSVPELATGLAPCDAGGAGCSLGELLDRTGVDFYLRYLHLRKTCDGACPSVGMWVDQGQIVGRIDDTGKSFTSHLHFEVRRRPDSGSITDVHNWRSVRQYIDGRLIQEDDNGACLKSTNELVRTDVDGDGILDRHDNCLHQPNADQSDLDGNGYGDACDDDRDGDGIPNDQDDCPDEVAMTDFDGDGVFDSCDPDADGDGVPEESDLCPFFDDAQDLDGDGRPDDCDFDADDDGFFDRCDPRSFDGCGCINDLDRFDPTTAGDHDGDGTDSLFDACPCRATNVICRQFPDMDPEEVDLGTVFNGSTGVGDGGADVQIP